MTKPNFTNVSNEDKSRYQPLKVKTAHSVWIAEKPENVNEGSEDELQWKRTTDGILPQISKVKYLSNYWSDLPQILNLGLCDQPQLEDDLNWKTTSNIKSGISQQLLARSSQNFILKCV